MKRVFTRGRLVAAGFVVAFLVAFAALGAVSKSSPTVADVTSAGTLPYAPWYWTMVVSKSNPNVLVLGTSNGVYRSADGAQTWKPVGPKGINTTSVVQLGSSMVMGGVPGPNPVARNGSGRTAPNGIGVLAISDDDGKTWQTLAPQGLPKQTVQALAVDPESDTVLYALLNNGALYRSADHARSFQLVSPKIGASPWALAVTDNGQFVAGDMDRGGFVSPNGKAWVKTPFIDSRGGKMVMEYAVHPTDSKQVLMSSIGIERSTDSGKTWRLAFKSKIMFGPVAWSPAKPDVAYAIGFDRSFWRSADGGNTWTKVS